MHRLTAALPLAALLATAMLHPAPAVAASTPPPPIVGCDPQFDVCDVEVEQPTNPGGATRASSNKGAAVPCSVRQGSMFVPVPCSSSAGSWSNALQCYVRRLDPQPAPGDPVWQGRTEGAVYLCTTALAPSTRRVWLATPPVGVSPEQLALQALASVQLPKPVVRRSPSQANADNGTPYTWVNLWTWWWTTPVTWRPLVATARAGAQWATVTVRPRSMILDPGDGSAPLTCPGPGRAWTEADADSAPDAGACAHKYTRVTRSGPLTASLAVSWSVTWTGSGGTGGVLPQMQTQTSTSFVVQQIQVVTR